MYCLSSGDILIKGDMVEDDDGGVDCICSSLVEYFSFVGGRVSTPGTGGRSSSREDFLEVDFEGGVRRRGGETSAEDSWLITDFGDAFILGV